MVRSASASKLSYRKAYTVILLFACQQQSQALSKEDDICQITETQLGLCKLHDNCPNSDYRNDTKCGDDASGNTLKCCPTCFTPRWWPDKHATSRKAAQLFAFTSYQSGDCLAQNISDERVLVVIPRPTGVGGVDAKPKEITSMAILGFDVDGKNHWGCGGSLISEKFVLTAGHCTYNNEVGSVKRVRLGDLNIDRTDDDAMPQEFDVVRIIDHPDYAPPSKYNDIALLELDRRVEITAYVRPIVMQFEKSSDESKYKYQAAGWGKLGVDKGYSPHLQVLELEYFANAECNEYYLPVKSRRKLKDGIVDDTQICAGHHTKRVDTCAGDSGGPLIRYENLVGVTSFGLPCGESNAPGIYTRVFSYLPWVESQVWG